MVGLVTAPLIFVWFLMRPGYARSTRKAALTYAFTGPAIVLAATAATILAR